MDERDFLPTLTGDRLIDRALVDLSGREADDLAALLLVPARARATLAEVAGDVLVAHVDTPTSVQPPWRLRAELGPEGAAYRFVRIQAPLASAWVQPATLAAVAAARAGGVPRLTFRATAQHGVNLALPYLGWGWDMPLRDVEAQRADARQKTFPVATWSGGATDAHASWTFGRFLSTRATQKHGTGWSWWAQHGWTADLDFPLDPRSGATRRLMGGPG